MGVMFFLRREILDLAAAWAILSVAFGILYAGNSMGAFLIAFPICLATVGAGFVLHELGHKLLAQRYGHEAHFEANYRGLGLAILLSFAGFVLVTPGAVYIRGAGLTKEQNGKISLLGPLMNLLLGAGFLMIFLSPAAESGIIMLVSWIGYRINAWIGLFNLIPVNPFDGAKIKDWNLPAYLALAALFGGMYLLSYVL
ncbi:MAG: metalloprotease [Candidatus Altiarchaeota archaeon]|nr:metalloprotease [Candidatus Altiarchaeota archaeon]